MMVIGVVTARLAVYEAFSLKDKRRVVKSLKDRLRNKFNVSVAEVDGQDTWKRSVVAVVTVSGDRRRVEEQLSKIESEAVRLLGGDLVSSEVEIL